MQGFFNRIDAADRRAVSSKFLLILQIIACKIDESPLLMGDFRPFGAEKVDQIVEGFLMLHVVPTGFESHCSKVVFRPRVDGKMGFGDGYRAAYPPGLKGVK